MKIFLKQFGAEYNCGAYGIGQYDSNQACQTATESGSLADTGTNMAVGLTGGILLVLIAAVLIIKTRRSASKASK